MNPQDIGQRFGLAEHHPGVRGDVAQTAGVRAAARIALQGQQQFMSAVYQMLQVVNPLGIPSVNQEGLAPLQYGTIVISGG